MPLFVKKIHSKNGGAAVEFGLLLPLFLLLLLSVIEYGWYFTHEIVLTNSVTEGARRAIKETDDENVEEIAREAVRDAFWLHNLEGNGSIEDVVGVDISPKDNDEPKRVTVSVLTMEHKQLTGFLPTKMVPDVIGARSVMTFP